MTLYFDPTRRAVQTPPPVAVKAIPSSSAPGNYFDPAQPRTLRSRYASAQEIAALADVLGMPEVEVWRRVAHVPKCATCGAPGDGMYGHRATCSVFREWRFAFDNWWFGRRAVRDNGDAGESETDDDEFFPF